MLNIIYFLIIICVRIFKDYLLFYSNKGFYELVFIMMDKVFD